MLLRFAARALLVVPLVLAGLFIVALVYPLLGHGARSWLNRTWSRLLLACCGVAMRVRGEPCTDGAVLWVANHVSWIDIFVLNRVRATAFVAKSEIRRWPVIGWLVAGAGTVFIERGRRHAVSVAGKDMRRRFDRGEAVGLFPEGTTSEGMGVRPFHASLFEPACGLPVTIQPVALRFLRHGRRSGYAAFVGEESLVANLWRVLGATGLAVEVVFLPPIETRDAAGEPHTRQHLARAAQAAIAAALAE